MTPGETDEKESESGTNISNISEEEIQLLTNAYEEVNEEVRYRDKLMHNSYYLVVIALVLAVGSLITLFTSESILYSPAIVVGLISFLFGGAVCGIGVVMLTYNEKRSNAARLRRNIARELGELLELPHLGNPFNFNQQILAGKVHEEKSDNRIDELAKDTEWFFRRKLSASRLALAFVFLGGIIAVLGFISLIIGIISTF